MALGARTLYRAEPLPRQGADACYDESLSSQHAFRVDGAAVLVAAALVGSLLMTTSPASQGATSVYTLIAASGRRALPFRTAGPTDLMPLDQLAPIFEFRVEDDPQVGGLVVLARGQRVLLTSGQRLISVGGRIVSLSGPVQREGGSIFVPVDFLSRALGPAINQRIEVRRGSHLVIVGDLRVPQLAARFERQGPNGRLTVDVQPPAVHRTAREGNRLVIRFEADALDPVSGAAAPSDFLGPGRVDGAALAFDLGPASATVRADDTDPSRVVVDLFTAAPPAPPPAAAGAGRAPAAPPPPAVVDRSPSGTLRTIVIDPGHGGEDAGVRGAAGAVEKDLTLQLARRLKAAIESRIGLRVLLTREGDEAVPIERRTALANNNKADLLISLHANASFQPAARGAQVLSLSLEDYRNRARGLPVSLPVPLVGGGTRVIDAMPWDLAQIPHVSQSSAVAEVVARHLTEHGILMYARPNDQAPLGVLVGANMPAVLVELGFLSNADDERALLGGENAGAIVEALIDSVMDVRNGLPAPSPAPER